MSWNVVNVNVLLNQLTNKRRNFAEKKINEPVPSSSTGIGGMIEGFRKSSPKSVMTTSKILFSWLVDQLTGKN